MSYGPVYPLVKEHCVNQVVKGSGTALREIARDFKGNLVAVKFRFALP